NMCARPIGMDLMEYYLLLKMIMIQRRSGEDGLKVSQSVELSLANACKVKHIPGKRTDKDDSQWLEEVISIIISNLIMRMGF
ncbi:MAG TPA: hypothetical protein VF360_04730, partial [Candidatus Methanoperedens sp.]